MKICAGLVQIQSFLNEFFSGSQKVCCNQHSTTPQLKLRPRTNMRNSDDEIVCSEYQKCGSLNIVNFFYIYSVQGFHCTSHMLRVGWTKDNEILADRIFLNKSNFNSSRNL